MERTFNIITSIMASREAAYFTKPLVEKWLNPKLDAFHSKKANSKMKKNELTKKFGEYLDDAYNIYSNMSTIVFKNQQKKIWDLYLPLTVHNEKEDIEITIDQYSHDFIPKYKKVILIDNAGMGKSTLMKWLFITSIHRNEGIPIFIDLRKLSADNKVIDQILNSISQIDYKFNEEHIKSLIRKGDFIFFFDGYDEIQNKHKSVVTEDLQEFISKAQNNLFIISSRREDELVSFGDFKEFNIKPLKEEEAFDLIRKYDNDGEFSRELIEEIKSDENLNILKEFLTNPLMVSLLYKSYEYKKTIPYKKHLFYEQIYNAIYDEHDLTKGGAYKHDKKCGLDSHDFEKMLKYISYHSYFKENLEYDRNHILTLIDKAKENYNFKDFKCIDFLDDLIHSVPLILEEGNSFRWVHKSFQEYFVSRYICDELKEKQKDVLLKMYKSNKSSRYYNILDFCYDLDRKSFEETIILDLLNDYIKYMESPCKINGIKSLDILKRKELNYSNLFYLIRLDKVHKFNEKTKEYKLNKVVFDILDKNKINFNSISTSSKYEDFVLVAKSTFKENIIRLLNNKNEEFIKVLEHEPNKDVYRTIKIDNLDKEIPIAINEEEKNPLNSVENFNKITTILKGKNYFSSRGIALDIDKCKRIRREIEERINDDKEYEAFI